MRKNPATSPGASMRLDRVDFWRWPQLVGSSADGFKEWQHVAIFGAGFDVLLNFSVSTSPDREPSGYVIALCRTDEWQGFVEPVVSVGSWPSKDGADARFGRHRFRVQSNGYRVIIDAPEHDIYADLELRARAAPLLVRNQRIASRQVLHWAVFARLDVAGELLIGADRIDPTLASAYHDHNWGRFSWGSDFAWLWGVVLSEQPDQPWAAVFSNLQNRARTSTALQHMLMWRGSVNVFTVGGDGVGVETRGCWRQPSGLRLPSVMALAHPEDAADIPAHLELRANRGDDEIVVDFAVESRAQLLIPSEADLLGAVALHECTGAARVSGRLNGDRVDWSGRGVFEFLQP